MGHHGSIFPLLPMSITSLVILVSPWANSDTFKEITMLFGVINLLVLLVCCGCSGHSCDIMFAMLRNSHHLISYDHMIKVVNGNKFMVKFM